MSAASSSTAQPTSAPASQSDSSELPAAASLLQRVAGVWDRLLADCADLGQLSLVSALTACQLDAAGDTLVIRVPDHRDTRVLLENGEQYESMVAGALTAHLGHEQPVSIIPADAAARRGRYRQAESHPLVQQLMDQFQAEILAFEPLNRNAWEQHLGSPGDATQPDSN